MMTLEKLLVACVLGLSLVSCRERPVSSAESALTVSPQNLVFGRAWVGRRATAHVTLRNEGRGPVEVTLSTQPPFSVLGELRLGGGEERAVEVALDAERPGPLTGAVRLAWHTTSLEVPLSAEVSQAPLCAAADCREVTFDPTTGACVEAPAADGTPCGATDACLVGGACLGGACQGQWRDCSDGDACTADSCDSATGCRHDDVSDACPRADNPCLAPACDPVSGCAVVPVADGTACGPNDCTTARVCLLGACVSRIAPEGSACSPKTTCREAGACRDRRCEVPPPEPMRPRWRYEPPTDHTLAFFGTVDDEGNAWATESWLQTDTGGNERDMPVTALVSITRDGRVRFKEIVIADCTSCQYGLALAVDTAGRRVFFNTRLVLQARSLDDGRLLWAQDVSQGVPTYDRRPDGGGAFGLSAPLLIGDTRVGVPLSEGVGDHHAYVRTFDRATGAPDWQLHKKGHLYGAGVDHLGELWLSSANCWAPAGELTRVAPSGAAQATRFEQLVPHTAWAGYGFGSVGNTAWLIDRTLTLSNLSSMDVPGLASAVMLRGNELITWESATGLMATDTTTGAHRFRETGLTVGGSPDFQLVRDGGVAWTGSTADGGVLGAIDGSGALVLSCVLPIQPRSPTAIVRGVAYVFARGGLSAFSVPELDAESGGWLGRGGSPSRGGRAR